MADVSLRLTDPDLRARLARALDPECRIAAAIAALGPVAERDVVCLEQPGGPGAAWLLGLGAWVRVLPEEGLGALPDGRADVIVAWWSALLPGSAAFGAQVRDAIRVLRPEGRLLIVHDYARDDVAHLAEATRTADLMAWSRPKGPLLGAGFRIRVLHCWWQWGSLEDAAAFLADGYGETGRAVAEGLRRPRLAYKVAVYHADRSTLSASLEGSDAEARPAAQRVARVGGAQPSGIPVGVAVEGQAGGSLAGRHGGVVVA